MTDRLLVGGDSVPAGARCDDPAWPARVATRLGLEDGSPEVVASMGWELAEVGERLFGVLDEWGASASVTEPVSGAASASGERSPSVTVLVQAGHNDCQLSGGEPRVSLDRFGETASEVDERLAAHDAVSRHAFVGLVPMGLSAGVSFGGDQPARSRRYDERLAARVASHVSVADATEWAAATVDGVHPNAVGHGAIADLVCAWLDDE